MASPRTRRLIAVKDASVRLTAATGGRLRLQQEGILLNRGIEESRKRLTQIDAEEEIYSAAMEQAAGEIAAANEDPPTVDFRKEQPGDI